MNAQLRRAARPVVEWAAVCLAVFLATPPQRVTPLRVVTVAGFLLVAGRVVAATAVGRRAEPALRVVPADLPPPGEQQVRLARLETSLTFATESARQLDRTVRPLLYGLVEDRLARRHGIDLTTSPAAARAIIGEELWQLFQTAPPATDGPGPSPAQLERLVAAVEAV